MFELFRRSANPCDEMLKKLTRRTLRGESVNFQDYLYALDDLVDEPEAVATEEEITTAKEARERFRDEMERFGLPLEPRFTLCQALYEKAQAEPSQALLRLLCYILCDDGTLLDIDPESHSPAQDALNWKIVCQNAEELYAKLSAQKQMSARFTALVEKLQRFRPNQVEDGPEAEAETRKRVQLVEEIQKAYRQVSKKLSPQFSERVYELLQMADRDPVLATVKPLFLYRVLTLHRNRMQQGTLELRRMDYRALWNYKAYKIEDDNGKNYKIYMNYLELFGRLYQLFAAEEPVDVTLCLYGFDHLSNLGDFYRACCVEKDLGIIPLEKSVEDWLLNRLCIFSCYEHGEAENILLEDSGLSVTKMERFQSHEKGRYHDAIAIVEQVFNRDLKTLTTRFLDADPDQVRALCREILDAAELPEKLQPKNETETALFLAVINSGLMESVDNLANDYLTEACRMLTGEYIAQNGKDG